jgi:hypothetical protein
MKWETGNVKWETKNVKWETGNVKSPRFLFSAITMYLKMSQHFIRFPFFHEEAEYLYFR